MPISESEEYGDDYADTSSHAAAAPLAATAADNQDMQEDRPVTYQGEEDDDFESNTQAHEPDLPTRPNLLANG